MRALAVHLDIRPRLTLPAEPQARARGRRRGGWRLPPLTVPAVGYWLAMGALTYAFTRLGPHPLDEAPQPSVAEAPPAPAAPEPATNSAPSPAPAAAEPPPMADVTPPVEPESAPAPVVAREQEDASEPEAPRARRRDDTASPRNDETEFPPARAEEPRVAMSFPEFTDSSRPKARERAADGPRIDSLFERAEDRPSPDAAPDAPAPPETAPAPTVVSSCEAAIARNNEQLTIGAARGPADITREAYAGILQNGRYLSACSIPDRTVFELCAAVKDGRAIGITIVSNPSNPALNACVRGAVARLKFPQNSRLDVTHTRFDAVKH